MKIPPVLATAEDLTGESAGRSQEFEALTEHPLERQKLFAEGIKKSGKNK